VNPDALTAQALLNCLVREVAAPEEQAWEADGYLMVRLARSGRLLRLGTRRPSAGPGPRLTGDVALRRADRWAPVGWAELAGLIADELTLATGVANEEFGAQVSSSHAAMTAIAAARQARRGGGSGCAGSGGAGSGGAGSGGTGSGGAGAGAAAGSGARTPLDGPVLNRYLSSEQALLAGHRFHPAPKARGGDPREWLPFAPEAAARFPLRFLAVRGDALDADGDAAGLDRLGSPDAPAGYHTLPAHPWQLRLLGMRPWLRRAFRDRLLIDLGTGPRDVVPTSSVRTVYDPAADLFCKFSLNVRITNCVRKNSWYELAGAVALSTLLRPVFADLAARFPGTAMLGEPGYRTVTLAEEEAAEGLSVIVREGLRGHLAPGATPVLAAALTEPPVTEPPVTGLPVTGLPVTGAPVTGAPMAAAPDAGHGEVTGGLLDGRDPDWLLTWWQAYVRAVALPALHALFGHGVVLEPHLQNVLVGVDGDGLPVQAIFRDLEGTKLLTSRHDAMLATLKPGVARALGYDAERGWHRVAYCLFVNHLAEIAAAVADRHPDSGGRFEAALWDHARDVLIGYAREHGWPPQLRALLAGVPLPAKANLRLRWARGADREAVYLPVRNPLGERASRAMTAGAAC
jgi:siderophore synthetase component